MLDKETKQEYKEEELAKDDIYKEIGKLLIREKELLTNNIEEEKKLAEEIDKLVNKQFDDLKTKLTVRELVELGKRSIELENIRKASEQELVEIKAKIKEYNDKI